MASDEIQNEMEAKELEKIESAILEGYRDLAEGRYFLSTGNFAQDQEIFKQREAENWQ